MGVVVVTVVIGFVVIGFVVGDGSRVPRVVSRVVVCAHPFGSNLH